MAEETDPNEDPNKAPEGDPNAEPNEPETDPDPEVEARAREMGWVPPEEFRGGAENALSAEEFVRRGEEVLPIVNKQNRELREQLKSVRSDVKELVRQMGEQRRSSHDQQVTDRKQAREKALEDGDTDTVKRLDREIEQLQQKAPEPPKKEEDPNGWTPDFRATFDEWRENNQWYGKDPVLSREFEEFHDWFLQRNPNMDHAERLKEAEKAVRKKYPQEFGGRRKSGGSPVEGGGSSQRKGSSKKKGYDDLPPEAKQAYDKFVTRDKVMKGEEYLKEFFGEEYEG